MANILTAAQAAYFTRTTTDDAVMLQLLPLVDTYLRQATGHDWTTDATKHDTAKLAAGVLLVYWYDNPLAIGQSPTSLSGTLAQLEGEALKYRKCQFAGLNGAGSIFVASARKGDVVISLTGVYGVSGDQSSQFESILGDDQLIAQTSSDDLSDNLYVVVLKHPADDISA